MNAFEKAWRLLKEELTPQQQQKLDEMHQMGMGAYAEEMRQMMVQQNQLAQQQTPQMTPQIQADYQDPLDAKKEKEQQATEIRRMSKGGRNNSKEVRKLMREYFDRYGHYPPNTHRGLRRNL